MSKYQFRVEVSPRYLAEQSAPEQGLYMFSYTVSIANVGAVPAQLISRTWNVNDANGHTERVKGLGTVKTYTDTFLIGRRTHMIMEKRAKYAAWHAEERFK